jgi:hypothetical protein
MLRQGGAQRTEERYHQVLGINIQRGNGFSNEKEQSGFVRLVAYGMKRGSESQGKNGGNNNLTDSLTNYCMLL